MPVPAIVAGAAAVAGRLAVKKVAKAAAKKAVAGKASGAKAKLVSKGKSKVQEYKSSSTKKYEPPVKGSGKPKYQNVVKDKRLNTKESAVKGIEKTKNILGKNVSQQEKRALGNKVPNIAKMIDREAKELKGQRTPKRVPGVTPKVPVKKVGKK